MGLLQHLQAPGLLHPLPSAVASAAASQPSPACTISIASLALAKAGAVLT